MGFQDKPTSAAIIEELTALQEKDGEDGTTVQRAIQLLELLPESMTEDEYATVLVPDESGKLVLLSSGICYHGTDGTRTEDVDTPIAHHLVTEALAEKLRMNRPSLEVEDDMDLGEKPITTIRNTLRQYDPKQFFTEFIANACDAKAKEFGLLIDEYEGPTQYLFSKGMEPFQCASLVVYNDGVFTDEDFKGIRKTGIGGKQGKSGVIGHFGLGALSMFHFTELATIISNNHVLFLNPAKEQLGYRGRNAVLLNLQLVKRLYRDHLEPLHGLFGFDLSASGPYKGTLFRLPLRNQSHLTSDPILTKPWPLKEIREMLLSQFDSLAYKSLLFTALNRIDILTRRDSQMEVLRSIESDRAPTRKTAGTLFKHEITTFKTTNGRQGWLVLSKSVTMPEKFGKILEQKYNTRHLLPVQIAAPLDGAKAPGKDGHMFCSLPLPVPTSLPVHISAPFILEQERRNVRLDNLGTESDYNSWLLTSEILGLYLSLLEILFEKRRTDLAPWLPTRSGGNGAYGMASQIFADGFWSPEVLATSEKRVFLNSNTPPSRVYPKDAILLFRDDPFFSIISTILMLSKPVNVVVLPGKLRHDATRSNLKFIGPAFVKDLLKDPDVSRKLTMDEKNFALVIMSHRDKQWQDNRFLLDGLTLLPLEDGSYATISKSVSAPKYYVIERRAGDYPPFRKERLVCEKLQSFLINNGYLTSWDHLLNGYNVSILSEEGIVELMAASIRPADEIVGDKRHEAWVRAFWKANLKISLTAISHFPIIPTRNASCISLQKIKDSSIIILQDAPSFLNDVIHSLQNLGLTIVVQSDLPLYLPNHVKKRKFDLYSGFLNYMQENPTNINLLQTLEAHEKDILSEWVRSNFSHTPAMFADVAHELPVWPAHQEAKGVCLVALSDKRITILPKEMPSKVLRPFTEHLILDWDDKLRTQEKPCSLRAISGLLRVSTGAVLSAPELKAYKRLVNHILKFDDPNYPLLVPDKNHVLRCPSDLYEWEEPFVTAFNSNSPLLSQDFQDIALSLENYGLKRQHRINLSMFIDCAKAFAESTQCRTSTRESSGILYQHLNSLTLSALDSPLCQQLDNLTFIPVVDSVRPGYDNIDTSEYLAYRPQDVLAPSQITIPKLESICWSQRGRPDPPPNETLCGTYQILGKPSGAEVLAHLQVLVDIAQQHPRHAGLLSDLKDTYAWLNRRVDDIRALIAHKKSEKIFLNVNDPELDEWVWHAASELAVGVDDACHHLHDLKDFLQYYRPLIDASGVRRVWKESTLTTIRAIPDNAPFLREQFKKMRELGLGTDVDFQALDVDFRIYPAHKCWLIANNTYFWKYFSNTPVFDEPRKRSHNKLGMVYYVDHSSACVKEVIDWIYKGELSMILTCNADRKLELGLEILTLSNKWQVDDLHAKIQELIINDPHIIGPKSVVSVLRKAREKGAFRVFEYCKRYQKENESLIAD